MKTCLKCGTPLDDSAKFCGKCGAPQMISSGQARQRSPQQSVQRNNPSSGSSYPYRDAPGRTPQDSYARQGRQNHDSFDRSAGYGRNGSSFDRGYQGDGRGQQNNAFGRQNNAPGRQNNAFGNRNSYDRRGMDPGYASAPKRGKGKLIALILALVAVIAAAAVVIFVIKPFPLPGRKGGKVETAVRSTLDSAPIISTIKTADVIDKGKVSVSANITVQGVPVTASFSQNPSSKEQSLSFSASSGGQTISLKEYLDKDAVYIDPGAGTVFKYGYTGTKNGALFTQNAQAAATFGMIDSLLKFYVDNMDGGSIEKDVIDKIENDLRALPVTDLEKRDFEIDGKTQSLTGRSVSVTPQDLKNIVNTLMSSSAFTSISSMVATTGGVDLSSAMDLSMLDQLGNFKINVYDYKNRLGALELVFESPEADGAVLLIHFKGSEPFDNIEISVRSNSMQQQVVATVITEKTSAGTKVSVNIQNRMTIYARYENNILTIGSQAPGAAEVPAVTCGLVTAKDSITISDITFNSGSDLLYQMDLEDLGSVGTIQGTIKIEGKSNVEKVSTSGAVDLGNASMEELQTISPDQLGILSQVF